MRRPGGQNEEGATCPPPHAHHHMLTTTCPPPYAYHHICLSQVLSDIYNLLDTTEPDFGASGEQL